MYHRVSLRVDKESITFHCGDPAWCYSALDIFYCCYELTNEWWPETAVRILFLSFLISYLTLRPKSEHCWGIFFPSNLNFVSKAKLLWFENHNTFLTIYVYFQEFVVSEDFNKMNFIKTYPGNYNHALTRTHMLGRTYLAQSSCTVKVSFFCSVWESFPPE